MHYAPLMRCVTCDKWVSGAAIKKELPLGCVCVTCSAKNEPGEMRGHRVFDFVHQFWKLIS